MPLRRVSSATTQPVAPSSPSSRRLRHCCSSSQPVSPTRITFVAFPKPLSPEDAGLPWSTVKPSPPLVNSCCPEKKPNLPLSPCYAPLLIWTPKSSSAADHFQAPL
ncbi:hypothetical protein M0R45_026129 [Rubus argutus]|uniref:Uncharacterized protein n=1 Tax=Rubus argutus TaxID=59490 RepID=A0AAW1WW45_RUBAR